MPKKVVITYGTFDTFHVGHILLLKRAKELGDRLIVALSTDKFNSLKNKQSLMTYQERKRMVENIPYVDLVIPEKSWEQKESDIKKYGVDVFVMGSDWRGKFNHLKKYCKVVYLPRTKNVSTTDLKRRISNTKSI